MSVTKVPADLIHHPKQMKENAVLFDNLCRIVVWIATPIVAGILGGRTERTGAEILTEETKSALATLAEDVALLEDLDERTVLEDLRNSLSEKIPPPSNEEIDQHTRNVAQVLVSTWLEILRRGVAHAESNSLLLSRQMLPEMTRRTSRNFLGGFRTKPTPTTPLTALASQSLTKALVPWGLSERDGEIILSRLRLTLFPKANLISLPFEMVLAGIPQQPVLLMGREAFERAQDAALNAHQEPIQLTQEAPHFAQQPEYQAYPFHHSSYAALQDLCQPIASDLYADLSSAAAPKSAMVRLGQQLAASIPFKTKS